MNSLFNGTHRPYAVRVTQLSPRFIKGPQWLLWFFPQDLFGGVAVISLGAWVFFVHHLYLDVNLCHLERHNETDI